MSEQPGFNTLRFLEKGFRSVVPDGMSTKEALITLALAGPAAVMGGRVGEAFLAGLQNIVATGEVTPTSVAVAAAVGIVGPFAAVGAIALHRKFSPPAEAAAAEPEAESPSFRM